MNPVPSFENRRAALDPNIILYRDRLECSLAVPAIQAERRRNHTRVVNGTIAVSATAFLASVATYAFQLLR